MVFQLCTLSRQISTVRLPLQLPDVGGDLHRLDMAESTSLLPFASAQERSSGPRIRRPRVSIANGDREEFEESLRAFGVGANSIRSDGGMSASAMTMPTLPNGVCDRQSDPDHREQIQELGPAETRPPLIFPGWLG